MSRLLIIVMLMDIGYCSYETLLKFMSNHSNSGSMGLFFLLLEEYEIKN